MRILAVDDSFDWLNTHTIMVTELFGDNTEVICASSAFEALNIYKEEFIENPFNLVITDLQMESDYKPLYAGEWLIKEILNLKRTQNILIVSSSFGIDQIANFYNIDFLHKSNIIADIENYENKLSNICVF